MKRFVSFLLAVILMVGTSIFGVSASRDLSKQTYASVAKMYPEVVNALIEGIENFDKAINLSEFNVEESVITDIFRGVIFDNPQLYYVHPYSEQYTIFVETNTINIFYPEYIAEVSQLPEIINNVEARAEEYLSGVDSSWSDAEKCRYIHDLMANSVEYDYDYSDEKYEDYTAYGVFVNKKAVCQGYTLAYNYLMEKLGIEAYFVENVDETHSWSMVKVDDDYYHIDVVWDDESGALLGRILHTLCLVSDEQLSTVRTDSWIADYDAKSDKFTESWWSQAETFVYKIEDKEYYIDRSYSDAHYGALMCYDNATNTSKVLVEIPDRWRPQDDLGYFYINFSALAYDGNLLYFNTPNAIYSVDLNGENKQVFYTRPAGESKNIYGLGINSQRSLLADLREEYYTDSFTIQVVHDIRLNINFVTDIQKHLVGIKEISVEKLELADINQDGKLNINDVTSLQRMLVGLQ